MKTHKKEFLIAFKASIPVMMGYIVLGFAFGLLAVSSGIAWYYAICMSVLIYAGALQFLGVGFISSKLGFVDIFIASIFVNIRQTFYGLSLLEKFKAIPRFFRSYLIFALTDETYALLSTIKEDKNLDTKYYYLFLALLNQIYWVLGSTLGAIFGNTFKLNTNGIEFSLSALFVVLAIEQYKAHKVLLPFIIGAISSILALIFVSKSNILIVAILLSVVGISFFKQRLENAR